ncbi:MAG: trypsin-like peptidase domain-containing protein [Pseudomonadota bacterium]
MILQLMIGGLIIGLAAAWPGSAGASPRVLVDQAQALSVTPSTAPQGEKDYRIGILLDRVLAFYPTSAEADAIRAQRSPPGSTLDVVAIRVRARAWAAQNPARAQELARGGGETLAPIAPGATTPGPGAPVRLPNAVVTDTVTKIDVTRPNDPTPGAPAAVATGPGGADKAATSAAPSAGLRLPPRARSNTDVLRIPPRAPRADASTALLTRPRTAPQAAPQPATPRVVPRPEVAPPQSRTAVLRKLRQASVLVYFVEYGARGVRTHHVGSGSFITPSHVLTNAHVVDAFARAQGTWLVMNEGMGVRVAQVVSNAERDTPIKIDAAVLQVDGYQNPVHLPLSRGAQVDEWIGIAGYPGDASVQDARYDALSMALIAQRKPERYEIPTALVDEGRLNNIVPDKSKKALTLQYTMITAPGNSGSPIINACGHLIGLHFAGYRTRVKYNIAEHAEQVLLYLRHVGLPHTEVSAPCTAGG